ncbi:MAG: IS5/IS1182 family transposase, partial [Alteromonas sp.]|nr:IS5/IS1182 family transposase [Alteromonas sp.]
DTSALDVLLDQVDAFDTFMADGAYDGDPVYTQILQQQPNANIVIPPPKNAVPNASAQPIRNQHVEAINNQGRMAWQKQTNYGLRALVELAMLRYKTIIGPKLKARELPQQKTEAAVSVRVLNRMTGLGMPLSVKVA